jgi:hypothetical protein
MESSHDVTAFSFVLFSSADEWVVGEEASAAGHGQRAGVVCTHKCHGRKAAECNMRKSKEKKRERSKCQLYRCRPLTTSVSVIVPLLY